MRVLHINMDLKSIHILCVCINGGKMYLNISLILFKYNLTHIVSPPVSICESIVMTLIGFLYSFKYILQNDVKLNKLYHHLIIRLFFFK